MRISAPTYTQTPNDLFDHWLPLLKESELKVILVIMRKTFGWHKKKDKISISQLMEKTGLSRETVIIAAKSLENKGLVIRKVSGKLGQQTTEYELIVNEDSNNSYQSEIPTRPVGISDPPLVGNSDPQKKHIKEKEEEEKNSASSADFKIEEAEKTSQYLQETYGLKISPFAIKNCVKRYGSDVCKKVTILLSKEKKSHVDKSAIFTNECKEMHKEKQNVSSKFAPESQT
jgi:phage replication O-like protein O